MQPSRGLRRIAHCKLPRQIRPQCRNLSSIPRHAHRPWSQTPGVLRSSQRSIAFSIPFIAAIRHASTSSSPPTQGSAPPPTTPDSSSFANLDTITLDNIDLKNPALGDITGIPEGIGYLKQIGLDYGIGPTSAIEWFLEHAHVWGDLPWWGSIVVTAFAVRIALFPLFLRSSDMMARQQALVSVTKPITDRMTKAQKDGDTASVMAAYQQLSAIRSRAGISMPQQIMPIIIQGIIGYCGFKLMRACAELPVPGFVDGGFLWLQDLTLTDGYLLMPIIMAGTIHLVVRLGGETGAASTAMPPPMKKFLMWGMPGIIALVTAWQPGAVCVWFASTGLMGIVQGQALQRASIRRFFGLAPLYKPKPGEGSGGFLEAMMKDKMEDMYGKAPSPAQPAERLVGKNAAFMRPTYQSPKLNRQARGRTVDTTLVTPQPSDTSTPTSQTIESNSTASSSKGMLSGVTDKITSFKSAVQRATQKSADQRKAAEKKAFQKRAAQYEEEAQRRGR